MIQPVSPALPLFDLHQGQPAAERREAPREGFHARLEAAVRIGWDALNAQAGEEAGFQSGKVACAGSNCRRAPTHGFLTWRLCDACGVRFYEARDRILGEATV